jgi:hypothetical protein
MIHIVVRATLDWNDQAAFEAQIPAQVRPGIDAWNATFDMPYHIYRRELKRIAGHSLARVEGAACVSVQEVPSGALVVPVDDDDWFAPELGRVLQGHLAGGLAGCSWPSRFLEVPISTPHRLGLLARRIFPQRPPRWLCTTNNYAVVYGPETADLLNGHIRATNWFLANPGMVRRLEEPLSLMNRTLASTTQLRSHPSPAVLRRKFRAYAKLYDQRPPVDVPWCAPYVVMMRELHAELRIRQP